MKCPICHGSQRRWIPGRVVNGCYQEGCYGTCSCDHGEVAPFDLSEQEVLDILNKTKAVIMNSHIVYTSGKHGTAYVNKDAVYPHTRETRRLCRALAERFVKDQVEVVIAPAVGGVILSQWTAYWLGEMTNREVLGVYAEKAEEPADESRSFAIKRGYDKLVMHRNVLVVEDILNTGGSAKKVVEAVRRTDGNVIALGALCNRGGVKPEDVCNVPKLTTLVHVNLEAWDEQDCPLCQQNIPINKDVGKGLEFLAKKQK